MEVLEFLKGTEWWPEPRAWDGAMLFLETSEEAPSPELVKRWLRNYGSQSILDRISAILFGRPGGGVPVSEWGAYDNVIQHVVRDEFGRADLPILTRMDFGHTDPMFVLPCGVQGRLDCRTLEFSLPESCCVPTSVPR